MRAGGKRGRSAWQADVHVNFSCVRGVWTVRGAEVGLCTRCKYLVPLMRASVMLDPHFGTVIL